MCWCKIPCVSLFDVSDPILCWTGGVELHVLAPTRALGLPAHITLAVHGTDAPLLPLLHAAYKDSIECVSVLRAQRSTQLGNIALALELFLSYCGYAGHGRYSAPGGTASLRFASTPRAVLLLRNDLRLKSSLAQLLVTARLLMPPPRVTFPPTPIEHGHAAPRLGFYFLWRELASDFRRLQHRNASDWAAHKWRQITRVPDVVHAFSHVLGRCFLAAIHAHPTSANMHRGFTHVNAVAQAATTSAAVATAPTPFSTAASVSTTMGGPMRMQAAAAGEASVPRVEMDLNGEFAEGSVAVGFLVDDGVYDSNSCRATCRFNPIYDILPRCDETGSLPGENLLRRAAKSAFLSPHCGGPHTDHSNERAACWFGQL